MKRRSLPARAGLREQPAAAPLQDVVSRFEAIARAEPYRAALSDGAQRYTCGDLHERINALCWKLRDHGVARGDRVALLSERSADHVIALMACLRMAAVAVPLDPALPLEGLQTRLAASGASLMLLSAGVTVDDRLKERQRHLRFHGPMLGIWPRCPVPERLPDDPACLLFEAPGDGAALPLLQRHRGLARLVDRVQAPFGYRPGEVLCQALPWQAAGALAELLPALCAGLHVHVLSSERSAAAVPWLQAMRQQRAAVAIVTTAFLSALNRLPVPGCGESLRGLRLLGLLGKPPSAAERRMFRAQCPQARLVCLVEPRGAMLLPVEGSPHDSARPMADRQRAERLGQAA